MKEELLVLKTESKSREMRLETANDFLLNSGINPTLLTEDDKMSIYSMLVIKAEKIKKKNLDKCFE